MALCDIKQQLNLTLLLIAIALRAEKPRVHLSLSMRHTWKKTSNLPRANETLLLLHQALAERSVRIAVRLSLTKLSGKATSLLVSSSARWMNLTIFHLRNMWHMVIGSAGSTPQMNYQGILAFPEPVKIQTVLGQSDVRSQPNVQFAHVGGHVATASLLDRPVTAERDIAVVGHLVRAALQLLASRTISSYSRSLRGQFYERRNSGELEAVVTLCLFGEFGSASYGGW